MLLTADTRTLAAALLDPVRGVVERALAGSALALGDSNNFAAPAHPPTWPARDATASAHARPGPGPSQPAPAAPPTSCAAAATAAFTRAAPSPPARRASPAALPAPVLDRPVAAGRPLDVIDVSLAAPSGSTPTSTSAATRDDLASARTDAASIARHAAAPATSAASDAIARPATTPVDGPTRPVAVLPVHPLGDQAAPTASDDPRPAAHLADTAATRPAAPWAVPMHVMHTQRTDLEPPHTHTQRTDLEPPHTHTQRTDREPATVHTQRTDREPAAVHTQRTNREPAAVHTQRTNRDSTATAPPSSDVTARPAASSPGLPVRARAPAPARDEWREPPPLGRADAAVADEVAHAMRPILDDAAALSDAALQAPGEPRVANHFSVNVQLGARSGAVDSDALGVALVDMLREAARRHGLEV